MTDPKFEELLDDFDCCVCDLDSEPRESPTYEMYEERKAFAHDALVAYFEERTSERYVVCRIKEMGDESLPPEYHDMLEMVLGVLRVNRRALRGDVPETNFGNTEVPR